MNPTPATDSKRFAFDHYYSKLKAVIQPRGDWTVAEFGVGVSGFGKYYAETCRKVYGIDIEDYSRHHPGVEFVLASSGGIPLPDQSLDMVVSHSVLEHVESLDASLGEIHRITKPGGYFFFTVNPLYYSAFGAHLYEGGTRLANWEHLDPNSRYYEIANPYPTAHTSGHSLNKMTSSNFLAAVGRLPWKILSYELSYEAGPVPGFVDRERYKTVDLFTKEFRFVGQRATDYPVR